MSLLEVVRLVAGVALVLLGPGLAWSFALMPGRRRMDAVERGVTAFALSLALVPLGALAWNGLFGLPLDTVGATCLVLALMVVGGAVAWVRR
jgi:uncharacterized membrane protein